MSTAAAQGPVKTGEIPSAEEIAREVTEQLKDKLEQSELDSLVTFLRQTHRINIPATATVVSLTDPSLLKFIVVADPDPKHNAYADFTFTGTSKAAESNKDVSGTYRGRLITNDLERLLDKTTAFWYAVSNNNLTIVFYDASKHRRGDPLGTFYGRSLGKSTGDGIGSWSRGDSHGHKTHTSN